MKNLKILIIFLAVIYSQSALPDSKARKEAEKFLETMKVEELLNNVFDQVLQWELESNPDLVPFKNILIKFLTKHLSYKSLKPDYIKLYENNFTAKELKKLNKFYKSKVGQKVIKKLPELMLESRQIAISRVQNNLEDLKLMILEESKHLEQLQSEEPSND